jgi:hypothetical protein
MSGARALVVAALLVSITMALLSAPFAGAQDRSGSASDGVATFGVSSEAVSVIGAWDFQEYLGNAQNYYQNGRYCWPLNTDCTLYATLHLPSGAQVTRVELDACKEVDLPFISFELTKVSAPTPTSVLLVSGGTDLTGTPGCTSFSSSLREPATIDNRDFTYLVKIFLSNATTGLRFSAVRVYYTLQVSPAPATASFGDVRTSHPFFQFVEAVARSGISAGCGGGNYCPDAPLTRGQMAVFLSKALGLHWAP